ncbi:helix-turn-helix transcriptional regulator [Stagnihabitans tardus]|uniref:Helix-turn-helix transcriptional regulator n=1 Tax=Stagnihabitans tardus TaxID=2699202 RepID=A0AAE4YEZ9_9RHOB|nr:helix-turn-helix transcriptional regulator [Stagnihabitans tardus]
MTRAGAYVLLLVVQTLCALFFAADILLSVVGIYPKPLSWTTRELMEIGALIGLFLGLASGSMLVWRGFSDLRRAEARLEKASGAFIDLLNSRFLQWGLTAAERDVAVFAIKGLTVPEIAKLRETSEGTVKAQTAAIYRKAGVSGRPQLLSLFIEDMMGAEGQDPGAALARLVSDEAMARPSRAAR